MIDIIANLDSHDEFNNKLNKSILTLSDRILAVVYLDIKYFKYFNDTYGYEQGDKLLYRMTDCIKRHTKNLVGVTRVVSDNIVVILELPNVPSDEIYTILSGQCSLLEDTLRHEFSCSRIRIAAGAYLVHDDDKCIDAETIISNANLARKKAKEAGSVSLVFFKQEMAESLKEEFEIISSIDGALENHEIKAFYQPKVDSRTGRIIGSEALVRWETADGHFIYPDQFIPAIEKSRQIIQVDYYMYDEVFKFLRKRMDSGEKLVAVSMNVSRQHMEDLDIIDYIQALQDKYQIPPEYLEFELTETVCMEDTDNAIKFIDAFHRMGMKVSMDDFGSGYSSLNLLSELPLDVIKLDRCFLHSNDPKSKERIVISHIISMAKDLDVQSLCEGVETEKQSDFLTEIGCDVQQGYFFSRPIPLTEFEDVLNRELKDAC